MRKKLRLLIICGGFDVLIEAIVKSLDILNCMLFIANGNNVNGNYRSVADRISGMTMTHRNEEHRNR